MVCEIVKKYELKTGETLPRSKNRVKGKIDILEACVNEMSAGNATIEELAMRYNIGRESLVANLKEYCKSKGLTWKYILKKSLKENINQIKYEEEIAKLYGVKSETIRKIISTYYASSEIDNDEILEFPIDKMMNTMKNNTMDNTGIKFGISGDTAKKIIRKRCFKLIAEALKRGVNPDAIEKAIINLNEGNEQQQAEEPQEK